MRPTPSQRLAAATLLQATEICRQAVAYGYVTGQLTDLQYAQAESDAFNWAKALGDDGLYCRYDA